MRLNWICLVLSISLLLSLSPAGAMDLAHVNCARALLGADPWNGLAKVLGVESPANRRESQLKQQVYALNFSKNMSTQDVRLLLRDLFQRKRSRFQSVKFDAQIYDLMAEEIAARGLMNFMNDNGRLTDEVSLKTRLRGIFRSRAFGQLASVGSFVTALYALMPGAFLKTTDLRIKPADMETLLLHGTESPEGQRILGTAKSWHETRRRFNGFARLFNLVSISAAMMMSYSQLTATIEEQSQIESDRFVTQLHKNLDEISGELESLPKTRDDVEFELTVKKLRLRYDREPTTGELGALCELLPAASACLSGI